jgi:hypothetical protein
MLCVLYISNDQLRFIRHVLFELRDAVFLAEGAVVQFLITGGLHAKIGSCCPRDFQLQTREEDITTERRKQQRPVLE